MSDDEWFTSGEVSRLTGATMRQLQWWAETGLIAPEQAGDGKLRRWGVGHLILVRLLICLRARGMTLHQISLLIRSNGQLIVAEAKEPESYLIIRGRRSVCARGIAQAMDRLIAQNGPVIVVDLRRDVGVLDLDMRRTGSSYRAIHGCAGERGEPTMPPRDYREAGPVFAGGGR